MIKRFSKISIILAVCLSFFTSAYAYGASVVPIGRAVGIQLYTDGLLVIGMTEVEGRNVCKDAGIKVNDRIISVNGNKVTSSEELSSAVNQSPQGVELELVRDNRNLTVNAVPVLACDNVLRLGLWVRDSCAGVGTVTYYNPGKDTFAALGHAINDVDTGNILSIKEGVITSCDILSVTKSSRGVPGEINASFTGEKLGDINYNTASGIFGKVTDEFPKDTSLQMTVASKNEVTTGNAYILSDILGQKVEKYAIKIKKVTADADKGIVLEITDERLINATGGIVQGMSGSPIIQSDKFVGAVTHVFVNNPLKGYGILAENMLSAGGE